MPGDRYVIESIRYPDGTPHERDARRKGHRVQIAHLKRGEVMAAVYVDDGGKLLRTTRVREIVRTDGDEVLVVRTRNSVYTFRKEGADTGEE